MARNRRNFRRKNPLLSKDRRKAYLADVNLKHASDDDVDDNVLVMGPLGPAGAFMGFHPESRVLYFIIDPDKDKQTLIDIIMGDSGQDIFPVFPSRRAIGGPGTIDMFWKSNKQKRRFLKAIAGAVQFIVEPNSDEVIVTHMAAKRGWKRKGVNSAMIGWIMTNHPDRQIAYHDLTDQGRKFMESFGGVELQPSRKNPWTDEGWSPDPSGETSFFLDIRNGQLEVRWGGSAWNKFSAPLPTLEATREFFADAAESAGVTFADLTITIGSTLDDPELATDDPETITLVHHILGRKSRRNPAQSLTPDVGLLIGGKKGGRVIILLDLTALKKGGGYDMLDAALLGYFYVGYEDEDTVGPEDIYVGQKVVAKHGWGPVLHEIAMQISTKDGMQGLLPDRKQLSKAAQAVWVKFFQRDDIQKIPFNQGRLWGQPHLDQIYSLTDDLRLGSHIGAAKAALKRVFGRLDEAETTLWEHGEAWFRAEFKGGDWSHG